MDLTNELSQYLDIGMVFKAKNQRINNGKFLDLKNNVVSVGYMNPTTGVDCANDFERMEKLYVTEWIKWVEIESDTYPYEVEVPQIFARRLDNDGNYDPNGEVITFYQSYKADNFLSYYMLDVVKVMRRIVSFIDNPDPELMANEKEKEEVEG